MRKAGQSHITITAEFNWKRGRVVECTGLENRRRCEPSVSSNLTASAKYPVKTPLSGRFLFLHVMPRPSWLKSKGKLCLKM
jgi:hypothetical protein